MVPASHWEGNKSQPRPIAPFAQEREEFMRVATKRYGLYSLRLEIMKADHEGDIYFASADSGFYISKKDVPGLIKALKWAAK
jgi:hypothetical protein